LAVGSWQLAVGSWQLAVGSWQLAVGSWPNGAVQVVSKLRGILPQIARWATSDNVCYV
jgi:hypothetical protein